MPIQSLHPDYMKHQLKWAIVRQAIASEYWSHVIPPEFTKGKNYRVTKRNENYIARAIFSNFTIGTRNALVGTATQKDPMIDLPPVMEYLGDDCTEDRLTIKQLIRKALGEIEEVGRFVMLTDFPAIELGKTGEEIKILNPLPRIRTYKAEDCINWDTNGVMGGQIINFVVLREQIKSRIDGFEWALTYQYRVLELDAESHYFYTIRDIDGAIKFGPVYPRYNGQLFDYIPIDVVGSEDNNLEIDESPLYPIAHVNFGHLRNSASYEDNLDAHAQGTLFLTSTMSFSQWKEMTDVKPVIMGSREGHYIGQPGSEAKLVQLAPGQELANAMKQKEEQMLAMGAHIITNLSAKAPVATTQLNMGNKTSPLVNHVKNIEQGLVNQLKNCALFLGVDPELVNLDLPKDFIPRIADASVMQQVLAHEMGGIISKRIVREYDRGVDLIPDGMTDEEIDAEILAEAAKEPAPAPNSVNTDPNTNGDLLQTSTNDTNNTDNSST
jgi:hypothetical protein